MTKVYTEVLSSSSCLCVCQKQREREREREREVLKPEAYHRLFQYVFQVAIQCTPSPSHHPEFEKKKKKKKKKEEKISVKQGF